MLLIDECSSRLTATDAIDPYNPPRPPRSPNKGLIMASNYRCVSDGGCTPCSFDIAFEYLGVEYDNAKCQYDSKTDDFGADLQTYLRISLCRKKYSNSKK